MRMIQYLQKYPIVSGRAVFLTKGGMREYQDAFVFTDVKDEAAFDGFSSFISFVAESRADKSYKKYLTFKLDDIDGKSYRDIRTLRKQILSQLLTGRLLKDQGVI